MKSYIVTKSSAIAKISEEYGLKKEYIAHIIDDVLELETLSLIEDFCGRRAEIEYLRASDIGTVLTVLTETNADAEDYTESARRANNKQLLIDNGFAVEEIKGRRARVIKDDIAYNVYLSDTYGVNKIINKAALYNA